MWRGKMWLCSASSAAWCVFVVVVVASGVVGVRRQPPVFLNQFAVHIPSGDEAADKIADKHAFTNIGKVSVSTNCDSSC